MQKLNTKGFGIVEGLLILLVVGIIGGVGYYVYQQKQADKTPIQTTQEASTQTSPEKLKLTDVLEPYSLPKGWTEEKGCDDSGKSSIILPPAQTVKCFTENGGGIVTIMLEQYDQETAYFDPKDCKSSENKAQEEKKQPYFISYNCDPVTIDNKQGVKETVVVNKEAPFTGAATTTSYRFYVGASSYSSLSIEYRYPKSGGYNDYTESFNSFVNTLKFK